MLKNFSCFKVGEKKSATSPDYRLTAKVGEQFVEIGAGWIKEGPKGKFISFKLSDPYQERSGWELKEEAGKKDVVVEKSLPDKKIDYPEAGDDNSADLW